MSLTARRRAEIVIERLGRAVRGPVAQQRPCSRPVPVLAEVLAFAAPLPELPGLPQIACLDEKSRACVADAVGHLGWEPGDLRSWREGHWLVLEPAGTRSVAKGIARLGPGGRISLPSAQRAALRATAAGSPLYVLPVPGRGALALCNPAAMLVGAPLGAGPTLEEHVKQVLANAGSPNTRRTWKTHYDRLVMGTAQHCSCTCSACVDLKAGCSCACKPCEDKLAIPPCADRVLAPGGFVKSELDRFKLVAERMAAKKAVRDNQRRAARGLVAKRTDGKGGAENFVTAVRHLFQALVDDGKWASNPAEKLKKPRRDDTKKMSLRDEEIVAFFQAVINGGDDPELDFLLAWFALECGARRAGIVGLTMGSLRRATQMVSLHEKGE